MTAGKHYQTIMQHYAPELGLSNNEFFSFSIVSGMLAGTLIPDEIEKKLAADFIAGIINDKALNERVNQSMVLIFDRGDEVEMGEEENPLRSVAMHMIEIIFHTRWLANFRTILEKARANHKIVMEGGSLSDDQKLTLHEYALVRDLAALDLIIEKLARIELVGSVGEMYQKILQCNQIIKDIELKMKVDQAIQPFFPIHKQRFYYEKLLNYFAHLTDIFVQSKLIHPKPNVEP